MSDADLEEPNSCRMLEPPSVEAVASVSAVESNQHDEMDVVFKVRIQCPARVLSPLASLRLPPEVFPAARGALPLYPATCGTRDAAGAPPGVSAKAIHPRPLAQRTCGVRVMAWRHASSRRSTLVRLKSLYD